MIEDEIVEWHQRCNGHKFEQIMENSEGQRNLAFRYDLNQIPYDYTIEVRNRFKGLDLIDSV